MPFSHPAPAAGDPSKSATHSLMTITRASRMMPPTSSTPRRSISERDWELDDLAADAHQSIRHLHLEP
jgi:hypothetical protein